MTALEKLISETESAREKATELDTISVEEMEEVLDDHGYFSCSENNKECAEFIIHAANHISKLTEIIRVQSEALRISGKYMNCSEPCSIHRDGWASKCNCGCEKAENTFRDLCDTAEQIAGAK